jgi:hypothetical protein
MKYLNLSFSDEAYIINLVRSSNSDIHWISEERGQEQEAGLQESWRVASEVTVDVMAGRSLPNIMHQDHAP